jgi:hypothetical protein
MTLLTKLDWSCFDLEEKEALAEFADLLQRVVEGDEASVLECGRPKMDGPGHVDVAAAGASGSVISLVCKRGHIMKDCFTPDAITMVNREGNPVKPGTETGAFGIPRLWYCGQMRSIDGSDGYCGPNNGPQCVSCIEFQMKNGSQLCPASCVECSTTKMVCQMGATCSCQTHVCMPCCMQVRSCVYAPFGSCNSRKDIMVSWLQVASFTLRDLLGRKLLSISFMKSEGFAEVMSYRCLFANGLKAEAGPTAASDAGGEMADKQQVLMRLLEMMQQDKRLMLKDAIKAQLAKNFITRDAEQVHNVYSILRAYLYHFGLEMPTTSSLGKKIRVHVLECFERTICMVVQLIHDPRTRENARSTISGMGLRAGFLVASASPAIQSAAAAAASAHGDVLAANVEQGRNFLSTPTPPQRVRRFTSESGMPLIAQRKPAFRLGRFNSEATRSSETHRSAQSLWRKVRWRTSMIAFFLVQRKRRAIAAAVRKFLLQDALSLDQVLDVLKSVEKNKLSVKDSLGICQSMCSKMQRRKAWAMLSSFRTLCLGSICSSWDLLMESGVTESLEIELRSFLLRCVAPRAEYESDAMRMIFDPLLTRCMFFTPPAIVRLSSAPATRIWQHRSLRSARASCSARTPPSALWCNRVHGRASCGSAQKMLNQARRSIPCPRSPPLPLRASRACFGMPGPR